MVRETKTTITTETLERLFPAERVAPFMETILSAATRNQHFQQLLKDIGINIEWAKDLTPIELEALEPMREHNKPYYTLITSFARLQQKPRPVIKPSEWIEKQLPSNPASRVAANRIFRAILPDNGRTYNSMPVLEVWQAHFAPLDDLPTPADFNDANDYRTAIYNYIEKLVIGELETSGLVKGRRKKTFEQHSNKCAKSKDLQCLAALYLVLTTRHLKACIETIAVNKQRVHQGCPKNISGHDLIERFTRIIS